MFAPTGCSCRITVGGRVQYGAFFSVTADLAAAKATADTTTDVILRLRLKHGRAVEDYSCFPDTQEIVALGAGPLRRGLRARASDGGFTYVDLVEESREHF